MKLIIDLSWDEGAENLPVPMIAVVDLTTEYVTSLIEKCSKIETMFPEEAVWSFEMIDDHFGIFPEHVIKNYLDEEQEKELEESGWIVVPDFEIAEDLEEFAVDTNRVTLVDHGPEETRCGVIWSCFPKHADIRIETQLIVASDILAEMNEIYRG